MRKSIYALSTAALLMGGLVGCNNNDEGAMGTRNNDNARPIGYYSNENYDHNDRNARNGNAYRMDDNDGPLTEIMDRTTNDDRLVDVREEGNFRALTNNNNDHNRRGNKEVRVLEKDRRDRGRSIEDEGIYRGARINENARENRNTRINNKDRDGGVRVFDRPWGIDEDDRRRGVNPYADNDPNTMRLNDYRPGDLNYHGHLHGNDSRAENSAYYNNYDGDLAKRIADKANQVANVDDARVVIMGDEILVAVDSKDRNNKNVEQQVRQSVKTLANDKNINVVTDEGTFTRVRDIDNRIREGKPREIIDTDIRNLFDNLGEALRRPFENNNNNR